MSVKLYCAYRLKRSGDLWALLRDTRQRAQKEVQKALAAFYIECAHGVDTSSAEYLSKVEAYSSEQKARLSIASEFVHNAYRLQQSNPYRNEFNFDVSLGVHELRKRYYLIPYCDLRMRKVLDFLKKESRLEDYSYWDNADPPNDLPYTKFKARGRVWDAIYKAGWDNVLTLQICDVQSYYQVDPSYDEGLRAQMLNAL